jgi:SAM-dependent methyltransferase
MKVSDFLDLFIRELSLNKKLNEYYRLNPGDSRFLFRKAYIEQRLEYLNRHLPAGPCQIWDAGCGFATASIFMALNGHIVRGTTLEYYYKEINGRLEYWSPYEGIKNLYVEYEDIFAGNRKKGEYDIILLQDTLHHLEPVDKAAVIFRDALKKGGKLVVIEENGDGIFIRGKNLLSRGLSRKSEYYDGVLGRSVILANEQPRSIEEWEEIFKDAGFGDGLSDPEYIRLLPPFAFSQANYSKTLETERELAEFSGLLRKYFFFGINFTVRKSL